MPDFEIRPVGELGETSVDFVVATAVPLERDTVLSRMAPPAGCDRILQVPWDESTYFLGSIGVYKCCLVLGDAGADGRDGSHQVVADAIARWNPRAVIMPGIAFGVGGPSQMLGDVLVSTRVLPYDHKKVGETHTLQRGPNPEAGQVLLNRAKNLFWTWTPEGGEPRSAIFGPVLSGNTLVNNTEFKGLLLQQYPEAVGGEMEGAGLYGAAERKRTEWIIIKGICDWGEQKTDGYHVLAVRNAVALTECLLSQAGLGDTDFRRKSGPAGGGVGDAARSLAFSDVQLRIRSMHHAVRDALDLLEDFLSKHMEERDGRKILPSEQLGRRDRLIQRHRTAVEAWLNAYNDGAARFLAEDIDREQFLTAFGEEIVQLFNNTSIAKNILESTPESYRALVQVHTEALQSELSGSASSGLSAQVTAPNSPREASSAGKGEAPVTDSSDSSKGRRSDRADEILVQTVLRMRMEGRESLSAAELEEETGLSEPRIAAAIARLRQSQRLQIYDGEPAEYRLTGLGLSEELTPIVPWHSTTWAKSLIYIFGPIVAAIVMVVFSPLEMWVSNVVAGAERGTQPCKIHNFLVPAADWGSGEGDSYSCSGVTYRLVVRRNDSVDPDLHVSLNSDRNGGNEMLCEYGCNSGDQITFMDLCPQVMINPPTISCFDDRVEFRWLPAGL